MKNNKHTNVNVKLSIIRQFILKKFTKKYQKLIRKEKIYIYIYKDII